MLNVIHLFEKKSIPHSGERIQFCDTIENAMEEKRKLNKKQQEAVTHGEGPLLIIAGAGTGKTTVVTERIKWLIVKKKNLPSEILALTFTDKAAREMEERVDVAMPIGMATMWISTFHSFCDRVLRDEAIHIGLTPTYKLMNEAETVLFLRKNLFRFHLDYFRPLGNPTKFLEGMLQHFCRLKDEDVDSSQYLRYAQKSKMNGEEGKKTLELARAYRTYEELKVKEGLMDFADLISNTLRLLRTRKSLLREYQNKFKYILVDEFQDTNYAQNELAILLAGGQANITVVGDDDQAIYRWRGAAISNIVQFRIRFPKAKIVTLVENYRSTQAILDHAYKLIQQNNPDRLEVKEDIEKKLLSVRKKRGSVPELIHTSRVEHEGDAVVQKILALVEEEKRTFSDFAILVRANNHSEPFVRALERASVPYQFLGPGQLFHQEEVKDLIAYLKVLYNFEDNISLYRILSNDLFEIPPRDLAAILNFARRKNLCLFEALEGIDEVLIAYPTKEKIKAIVAMVKRHLRLMRRETAGQILYFFLEDTGMLRKLMTYKTSVEERRVQNIAKFFDKLKTYEVENKDATVPSVVDWIDLSMQMGESPLATNIDWTDNNAVSLLTVHASKGLEFDVVFLVNLVVGRFPTRERREQIPIPEALIKEILPVGDYHLEEERRLFYVGMTRARDRLFLTASDYYGEGRRERKLSPFVFETLGQQMIQKSAVDEQQPTSKQLSFLEWSPQTTGARKDEPKTKRAINYLSFSQIETFNVCPLHYKAKYILRLQVPQTAAQSFGTSLHATLRDFYQELLNRKKVGEDEAFTIFKKNWINEGYQSKRHEALAFKKGVKILDGFLRSAFDKKNLPSFLELPFQFSVSPALKIGGKIDRIDKLTNGTIEVLDYKTGASLLTQREIDENLQLTIYALAVTEIANVPLPQRNPKGVLLSFYFLESGQKLTTQRTKEQLSYAKEALLRKAEEIEKSDFRCSGGTLCQNCEYKMLCG